VVSNHILSAGKKVTEKGPDRVIWFRAYLAVGSELLPV